MESNLLNSASDFLYHTNFYFNILSSAAKISARWLHCHKHGTCYSIVSCSPLILIGAHFFISSNQSITRLISFQKHYEKNNCVQRSVLSRIRTLSFTNRNWKYIKEKTTSTFKSKRTQQAGPPLSSLSLRYKLLILHPAKLLILHLH